MLFGLLVVVEVEVEVVGWGTVVLMSRSERTVEDILMVGYS